MLIFYQGKLCLNLQKSFESESPEASCGLRKGSAPGCGEEFLMSVDPRTCPLETPEITQGRNPRRLGAPLFHQPRAHPPAIWWKVLDQAALLTGPLQMYPWLLYLCSPRPPPHPARLLCGAATLLRLRATVARSLEQVGQPPACRGNSRGSLCAPLRPGRGICPFLPILLSWHLLSPCLALLFRVTSQGDHKQPTSFPRLCLPGTWSEKLEQHWAVFLTVRRPHGAHRGQ